MENALTENVFVTPITLEKIVNIKNVQRNVFMEDALYLII